MRSRTTRVPCFSARIAMRSQASHSRCEKQALPPSNSVSASSCHSPYQPIAEAADEQGRRLFEPADQPHHVARHLQPRAQDAATLSERPRRVGDRLAGEVDDGVDALVARDLVERGDQPERRSERRGLARVAHQHRHLVSGAGQPRDQPAADEPGRASDEHMLPFGEGGNQLGGATGDEMSDAARGEEVAHAGDQHAQR
jgi:hypothetical protein